MAELISVTDGRIRIQSPQLEGAELPGAARCAVAGHSGVISIGNEQAGWVGYDADLDWLGPGEVRVRYSVHAQMRSSDAIRAVQLLLHHLAARTPYRTAILQVQPGDADSMAVAAAAGFTLGGAIGGIVQPEEMIWEQSPGALEELMLGRRVLFLGAPRVGGALAVEGFDAAHERAAVWRRSSLDERVKRRIPQEAF